MSQYLDFVDYNYKPKKTDLICLFRIEPAKNMPMNEAIGRVAAESSNGTWTELTTLKSHIRKIRARGFKRKELLVKIAMRPSIDRLPAAISVLNRAGLNGISPLVRAIILSNNFS